MTLSRLFKAFHIAMKNALSSFVEYYKYEFDPLTQDALTKVYNRRHFECRRKVLDSYSLLLIDLDNFKTINDRHGHEMGDQVLKAVAAALRMGSGDRVFRVGGEEFAVLLRCDAAAARIVAERLCTLVRNLSILESSSVTVSVGLAWSRLNKDHDEVYRMADRALYCAKGSGKDRVMSVTDLPLRIEARDHSSTIQHALGSAA
jgi:diguanylate cyclase (GGDEF)-like protein